MRANERQGGRSRLSSSPTRSSQWELASAGSTLLFPRAIERLNWLQDRTDAASHTEVIRQALFVYEQAVGEYRKVLS